MFEDAKNLALLGCYAASRGNSLPTFRDKLLGPNLRVQAESKTDKLSRNVGNKLPLLAAYTTQKITVLAYFATEV